MNVTNTPDGKNVIALHSGYNPHGLVTLDPRNVEITQKIGLKSAWYGMAWAPDGKTLYVSGGNGESRRDPTAAPIYAFSYAAGKLSEKPAKEFRHHLPEHDIYWSGLVHHPTKPLLYAANRRPRAVPSEVVVFNTETGERVAEIPTDLNPYDLVLDAAGDTLFISNWASESVTVIDTKTNRRKASIKVGHNPNDMVLAKDGRLFVAC